MTTGRSSTTQVFTLTPSQITQLTSTPSSCSPRITMKTPSHRLPNITRLLASRRPSLVSHTSTMTMTLVIWPRWTNSWMRMVSCLNFRRKWARLQTKTILTLVSVSPPISRWSRLSNFSAQDLSWSTIWITQRMVALKYRVLTFSQHKLVFTLPKSSTQLMRRKTSDWSDHQESISIQRPTSSLSTLTHPLRKYSTVQNRKFSKSMFVVLKLTKSNMERLLIQVRKLKLTNLNASCDYLWSISQTHVQSLKISKTRKDSNVRQKRELPVQKKKDW